MSEQLIPTAPNSEAGKINAFLGAGVGLASAVALVGVLSNSEACATESAAEVNPAVSEVPAPAETPDFLISGYYCPTTTSTTTEAPPETTTTTTTEAPPTRTPPPLDAGDDFKGRLQDAAVDVANEAVEAGIKSEDSEKSTNNTVLAAAGFVVASGFAVWGKSRRKPKNVPKEQSI